jgi:diguanylate cyclase (GGDEF)-like protein
VKTRLSTRLLLCVIFIEAVMLTTLVWNSVRLISSSHANVLKYHIDEEATLLANLLAPGLAVNDRAILLDALSLVSTSKNIVYAAVLDASGNLMAAIGTVPPDISPDETYQNARQDGVFDAVRRISLTSQKLGTLKIGYSIAYVELLIDQTRLQNTTIAAIALFLSILATLVVGYFMTRSLRKLEEGTKALARDELDYRIDLNSRDEIGDLARSFNKLAHHLALTRADLAEEHDALERQKSHLQTLMDGIDAVIVETDPLDLRFTYVSQEAQNLLGFPTRVWLEPQFIENHIYPEDLGFFKKQWNAKNGVPGTTTIDFRMSHSHGHLIDIRSINTFDYDASGTLICRSLLLDVTEQKLNERRIVYLAEHDGLTGLYNRSRFQEELDRALDYAERFDQQGALMFIDLDQFKYINDTMGHLAGDEYLCTIAKRLAGSLRKIDVLGRLGGDEFGVLLPNTNPEEAERVATHLLQRLFANRAGCPDIDTPVSASIGIVIFPRHGTVPSNLLAIADAAMYSAKDKGRNTYHLHSETDKQITAMHAKLQWEQRIRSALENDLFVLHYQPVLKLDSLTVAHYEVLLRMADGEGGLILPAAFLDVAERFGMIRDIDRWVLRKAIQVQSESCGTAQPVGLAINLSGRHFGDPQILEWIRYYIQESGADPSMLIFEITETAAVENIAQANQFTNSLHALGCRIALDDFGVGFSSFHYLKHLPVDIIKIDGSFVRNLPHDRFDRVFVQAMSNMARGLGIISTAEFIESEEITPTLLELDVDMGQGFYLAPPTAYFALPDVPL